MMQALQLDLDLYPRFEFDHKMLIVNSDAFDICDYYSYFLSDKYTDHKEERILT